MIRLFVYGTLQHGPLLDQLLGRVPESEPAVLPEHRAAPLLGRPYPGLVVDPTTEAAGRLVHVTETELVVLDHFEGPEYERSEVVAIDADGSPVACQVWLLTGPSRRLVVEGSWDLERFLAEDVGRFLGGSIAGEPHPGAGP